MSDGTLLLNIAAGKSATLVGELSEENSVKSSMDCTLLLLLLFPVQQVCHFDDPAPGQSTVWPVALSKCRFAE